MPENLEKITYFAQSDHRGKKVPFGIKALDRMKHVYVIGKTGMGKSVLLENMAAQDILSGNGMAFIDPHGSAAEGLLDYVPEERIKDVIYFAPFDMEHPISFNIMEDVGYDKRHLVVSGLLSAFKKIWVDAWSARMEYILQNTLLALLEYPDSTILGVNRMLIDKAYRKQVVDAVTDPIVKSFWVDEFSKYTDRYTQEATPAIQNKIGQFVSNPLIRNIVGQVKSSFDFRKAMDEKKILIMNLSKGRIGDLNAKLIGSMLIIKVYLAAMSRADLPPGGLAKLPAFYFYVDEFQSFANETFADILSESRKYKLSLTIAHQYVEQMPEEVRDAVFGNVGTMLTFRVGAYDAEVLEKEFSPTFTMEDLVNLGAYQIYLKLMIDGVASKPFSATTLPPLKRQEHSNVPAIIAHSRGAFARPRVEVEDTIKKWHEPVVLPKAEGVAAPAGSSDRKLGRDERPATFVSRDTGARVRPREDVRPREELRPRETRPAPVQRTTGETARPQNFMSQEKRHEERRVPPTSVNPPMQELKQAVPTPRLTREQSLPDTPKTLPPKAPVQKSSNLVQNRPFEKAFIETPPSRPQTGVTASPRPPSFSTPHMKSPDVIKSISLESLKKKKETAASSENRESLRAALSQALKENTKNSQDNPVAEKEPNSEAQSRAPEKDRTSSSEPKKIGEIPEAELRAMLDVQEKNNP